MASQAAHLPYGGCLPKALGPKVQSWNREKGTSWQAIKLRPGFFHWGDGLTVKRKHSLGSGACRSSCSSTNAPSALPSLTLCASQSSGEYNDQYNSLFDNGCRNREIMMNQQVTQFIRPEGTQGQSPTDSFSINYPILPNCRWIIDLGILANTGEISDSWKMSSSLNPNTRKTQGHFSGCHDNILYVTIVSRCYQAPQAAVASPGISDRWQF